MIVKPITKGICSCCLETNILINNCITEKCDYNMCDKCYYIYYSENTKCPACRIVVEKSFKNNETYTNEIILDNTDSDDDENQEQQNTRVYYFCNNYCCECVMAFTTYHNISMKKLIHHFIKYLLYFIVAIFIGRVIYLFTMVWLLYQHDKINTEYFHNNMGDFILTSILGLLMLLGTLLAFWFSGCICYACCCDNDNDDNY
tara:strand:+ start:3005 stop:3610 length:606 start_codon:yes stop_codon:yes gene_type:complete